MVDTSVIRIDQLEVGSLVKVCLPTTLNSRPILNHEGLFFVVPDEEPQSLNHTTWRKLAAINKRSFFARVINNDNVRKELTVQFADLSATKTSQLSYIIVLPYASLISLARLIPQGRTLTPEQETAYRHKHVRPKAANQYIHPLDRFVPVTLIALTENVMLINFTYQTPTDGQVFEVILPAGVFNTGNYTVSATINTIPGLGNNAFISIPQAHRNSISFTVEASSELKAGTTIDFFVKEL